MYYAKALCQQVNPQVFGSEHAHKKHEHKKHEHKHAHKPEHKPEHTHKAGHVPAPASHAKRNTSHPGYLESHTPAPASHWDRNKIYTQDWIAPGDDYGPQVTQAYSPVNMLKPLGWVVLAGLGIGAFGLAYSSITSRGAR